MNGRFAALASFHATTEGEELFLTAEVDGLPEDFIGQVTVELAEHDDINVMWVASIPCVQNGVTWQGRFVPEFRPHKRLLELTKVYGVPFTEAPSGPDDLIQIPKPLPIAIPEVVRILEPDGDGSWSAGSAAEAERQRLELARATRYDVPIIAPGAVSTDPEFAAIMIVDGLLLTQSLRVSGIRLMPLEQSTLGVDVLDVLISVMPQFEFEGTVDTDGFMLQMRRRRPSVVVFLPRVRAQNPDAALAVSRRSVHQMIDLMALNRGAAGRILGGAVGVLEVSGKIKLFDTFTEGNGYGGNLIGGFTSGEDQHGLLQQWNGVASNPRARLWLSLYADALADDRWEFKLFRCFSLMESIGKDLFPGVTIVDDVGHPRMQDNGQNYTTREARGAVFELMREVAVRSGSALPPNCWDEVGVWAKIRNEVAHRGGWPLAEGEQADASRQRLEAQIASLSHDATTLGGIWSVLRSVRTAMESVLHVELRGRL